MRKILYCTAQSVALRTPCICALPHYTPCSSTPFLAMSRSRSNHSDIFISYDHQLNEIIDPEIQADAQRIAKRISAKSGSRPSNGFMAFKHHRSEDPQSREPLKAGEDWRKLSASEKQKWSSVYEASKKKNSSPHGCSRKCVALGPSLQTNQELYVFSCEIETAPLTKPYSTTYTG